ncbi:hypothetical protein TSAR_005692 [Trichomalopsis sarcophagae]|uniref:Uncharacterized protein n=1 Tax=Trichomalopsis sarcophagae TaxID=543379 RepID=A0A232FIV6_9HYME|nr:hypothetical protein TSAR_005692 [Trichomalopsis sarcophagae]
MQNTRRRRRSDYKNAKELDSTTSTSKSFPRLARRTKTAQDRVELPGGLPRDEKSLPQGRSDARTLS